MTLHDLAEKLKKANRRPRTLLDRDLPLKTERLRGMTPEKLNKMLEEYNKKNSNKPDFHQLILKTDLSSISDEHLIEFRNVLNEFSSKLFEAVN